MKSPCEIPLVTYRLQLNRDFTFAQAAAIVPYLAALGISHCYISPCLKARSGSMHGYDIVDHNSLNPEIGTPDQFDHFANTLHEHAMGLILDIVPNHMAVMGSDNAWWLDVLENGESSHYADYFDIDWSPLKEELHGKVLIPVLHDHYGAVLESGDLKLAFHPERGEFDVMYKEHRFPVDPKEYPRILQPAADKVTAGIGGQDPNLLEFQSLLTAFRNLPGRQETAIDRIAERSRDKEIHKRRLVDLVGRSPQIASAIAEAVGSFNGTASDPSSFEELHELIKAQAFRLANWRVASDDINYRRFFDTNDLAAIRVEKEEVFQATHRLVLSLVSEGKVDGLRVDHPDGLYDPEQYFQRLHHSLARAADTNKAGSRYVIIEKILSGSERLPGDWPVSGTTGYDFSNLVNGLFVNSAAAKRMDQIYRNFVDDDIDFDELSYRCRKLITRVSLASELNVLANRLTRIALSKRRTCDFTLNSLRDALTEVVANFPVYRTYVSPRSVSESDVRYIRTAVALAKWRSPAADTSIFDFVGDILLTRIAEGQDSAYRDAVLAFAMRFQQFSSPVMAKGLEDTTFYRYNRLVSLNEVGGDLHRFGTTPVEFHSATQERRHNWPHTLLATSTHDSKRSEDVRARIDILSEIGSLWSLRVREWRRFNRGYKSMVENKAAPSPNDEYLLYQTLVGTWPAQPFDETNQWELFSERIDNYMLKAIRESKRNTSWINRNVEYEEAMSSFVKKVLTSHADNRFLDDFVAFQRPIARAGLWNSLSQTLLKLTAPGVPDIYQGNETWDFSLVDPDNRRPVDYLRHERLFASMRKLGGQPGQSPITQLLETPDDGRLKMFVIWKTLCFRQQQPQLFQQGEYLPLTVEGINAGHIVAFARAMETKSLLVVVPRLIAGLLGDLKRLPMGSQIWKDTQILLPATAQTRLYRNLFTGQMVETQEIEGQTKIEVGHLLSEFPVALCVQE